MQSFVSSESLRQYKHSEIHKIPVAVMERVLIRVIYIYNIITKNRKRFWLLYYFYFFLITIMDNRTFVNDYAFSSQNKKHWNLFIENGVMYSYWYHYPLLFKVNWLEFVNNSWYSSTTSKHIAYAPYSCYSVKLRGRDMSFDNVLRSLNTEKDSILIDIRNCVRETSQKKTSLLQKLDRVAETIRVLQNTVQ